MPGQHNIIGRKSVFECPMMAESDLYFKKFKLKFKIQSNNFIRFVLLWEQ